MLPTALRKTRWRKPPPSRRVEVTGQCATLTSAGSTPVACSARAICQGEDAPGLHERSSARHPTRTTPSPLASVWIASPDARCERQHAPKARRELSDAYPSPIVVLLSRAFVPKNDRRAFSLPGSRAPGQQRTQHGNLDQVVVVEMPCRLHARVVYTTRLHEGAAPRPLSASQPVRDRSSVGRAPGC
jgi:hypothetical protein